MFVNYHANILHDNIFFATIFVIKSRFRGVFCENKRKLTLFCKYLQNQNAVLQNLCTTAMLHFTTKLACFIM